MITDTTVYTINKDIPRKYQVVAGGHRGGYCDHIKEISWILRCACNKEVSATYRVITVHRFEHNYKLPSIISRSSSSSKQQTHRQHGTHTTAHIKKIRSSNKPNCIPPVFKNQYYVIALLCTYNVMYTRTDIQFITAITVYSPRLMQ